MELYEEVETKKSKLPMIIGICIAVLTVLIIVIIALIFYLQGSVMKITLDGQKNNDIEKILYIPEDENNKIYIPIRDIAKYFNYQDYSGDYNAKSEDSTKCYVMDENEVAMFTKESDKLVKINENTEYEYITLDENVFEKDGKLYTTPKGIEKAFNVIFEYNLTNKKIDVYTMEYLNQIYAANLKIDGETEKLSEEYEDKKSIFEGMMITIKDGMYGIIDVETGKSILENKYEEIKYLSATSDFLIKSNGKYGIVGKNADVKVRFSYDEIKIMDNQNELYLVKQNSSYGIVDSTGKVILNPEYKQIGIDIGKYSNSGIENQYVLLDEIIPVMNNDGLWGIFDTKGEKIRDFEFTGIGCTSTNSTKVSNAYPAVVIPSYKIIIVEKDKHYNLMTVTGEELVPSYVLETVYMKNNSATGENNFYMAYNNNEKVMSVEEWLASTGR